MNKKLNQTLKFAFFFLSVVARRCTHPTTIKGIDIPLDLAIVVDVMSIHYDPELWGPVDPSTFYPQRFAPEHKRNPLAFLSFGTGPRNCIGMKFALIELKMALVKLLLNYEIRPDGELPTCLEFKEAVVRVPKNEINVVFRKRENSL